MPNDPSNPLWNSSCSGCIDSTALNYDASSTIDDGSCTLCLPTIANLFISEYAEGSTQVLQIDILKYTILALDTVDLTDYAFARVSGNPTDIGIYETWNNFDSGAVILPNDVYVVAHSNADNTDST